MNTRINQNSTGINNQKESPSPSLGDVISSHLGFNDQTGDSGDPSPSPRPPIKKLKILRLLKPIPWLLLALFILSFFWDLNGVSATLFGLQLQFDGLLRIIAVSGMIGFLTNWIAITMLFRPLKKRPLLGQGLIPAHKNRIAYRLSSAVSDDLINPDLIRLKLDESKAISKYRKKALSHIRNVTKKEEFRHDLKQWILEYINSQIQDPAFRKKVSGYLLAELDEALKDNILEKAALKTYSFFRGQTLEEFIEELLTKIPVSAQRSVNFIDEYLDELPDRIDKNSDMIDDLITQALDKLINQLNVQAFVEENLRTYDEVKLENMIRNATNEQLKTIQYLGAVLGTIGGFVIWEPVLSLSVLLFCFGTIYIVDRILYA